MKYCIRIIAFCFGLLFLSSSYDAVAQIELNCSDGIDNDNDGLVDCQDGDCNAFTQCAIEGANNNCSDGIDNDGDGKIDCADNDPGDCDCTQPEICNNYIDDDGDGLIDCKDGDCENFVGCERECNNGVDDDGDGFFDYYDGDCLEDPNNPNDYLIIKPDCEARPQGNVFNVNEAWRSADQTANNRGMPAVADIDGDGTPEVISFNKNKLYLLNGIDGSTERTYDYPDNKGGDSFQPLTVGDIDNDGYGEIFHLNDKGWLRGMDFDPTNGITTRWTAKVTELVRYPGLADFNRDGQVEIYFGNEIRDAATGAVLVAGSHGTSKYPSGNDWEKDLNALPVAVDILPDSECATCNGLELVLGHVVYAVDLTGGKLTEVKVMDAVPDANKTGFTGDYHAKTSFNNQSSSTTAVVDYNQDGFLDVLMSGAIDERNGPSAVFFWDLKNNSAKAFVVSRPGSTIPDKIPIPASKGGGTADFRSQYKDLNGNKCDATDDCTWQRGVGSLNIANINTDGNLECTFMSGSSLYAIDQNMNLKWANHTDFWESTSGITGTAVFNFDGDGASEVIYRDQVDLYVVDGENGQVLNSQYTNLTKCSSNTAYEYPIVADVDGDGETEIIVTCSTIENEKYESATTSGGSAGHVRIYKASEGQFWVPARSIWNQFTYFNVNVNDNMTIPRYQQPHHLNFSEICNDPNAPNRFSLNKFLNQSPRITFCGDLAFPASKLDFADDGVVITPPVCPEDSFMVQLIFENTGDYTVNQPVPFAFYAQDPTLTYSNADPNPWLDTVYVSVPGGIKKNQKVDTTLMIRGARGQFTLYVSMNDIGPFDKTTKALLDNTDFYPLNELNGTIRECDGTPTVVSKLVDPIPFEIIVSNTDNRRCDNSDDIGVNNGKIKIVDEDGNPLTPLSNYALSLIDTRTNTPVDISASIADLDSGTFILGLDSGTYVVSAQYQNDAFSCGSVVDTVVINRTDGWPGEEVMTVEKIADVSSCKPGTADGEARVLINGIAPDETTYEIRWRDEQNGETILGASVANLKPVTYDISVLNKVTGCSLNDSSLVMDLPLPVQDSALVVHATSCSSPNGTITAQMASGPISQYDFQLIQKSPLQDTTFSDNGSFTDLAEGIYELVAYDPANDCGLYSSGIEVIIETNSTLPDLLLTQVSPQSACDPTLVNGHLRATPASAGSYAYTWYKGTVTTGPGAEVVATAADATELSTYNNPSQLFTVVMVDDVSGCSVSDTVRLFEQIIYPEIDPIDVSTIPRTYCGSLNGQITVSVGGNTTDFTFDLYEGTTATGTPFAQSTDGSFTGLDSIQYTIVAIDTRTGCVTPAPQALTVKVPGATKAPVVVPTVTNQSSCDPTDPNGAISVTADGSTSTADYEFDWLDEDGINYNTPTITDLKRGNYLLTVTDRITQCDTTLTVFVDDEIYEGDDLDIVLDIDNVDNCSPFNGRIEVTDIVVNGNSTPVTNYTFEWYKIENPGLDSTQITGVTGSVIDGLMVGRYSVQAFSTVTRCYSLYQTDSVRNDAVEPNIDVDPVNPMTDCINPDGQFSVEAIDPTGTIAIDDYIYHWYLGADTLGTRVHEGRVIDDVRASVFTIVVTDPITGCKTVHTDDLAADGNLLPVFVSDPVATHIETCPGTGTVSTEVDLAVGAGNSQDDYVFYWFLGKSAPQSTAPGARPGDVDTLQAVNSGMYGRGDVGRIRTGLDAGFYTVLAVYPPDQCQSIPKFVEVKQIARKPVIQVIDNKPDSLCNTLTGRLEIVAAKATDDTTPLTTYTYLWSDNTTVNSGIRTGLAAGDYSVIVTDDQTGCSDARTFTIRDRQIKPIVMSAMSDGNFLCLDGSVNTPNGTITVDRLTAGSTIITNTATFESDYNFYLYEDESDYNPNTPASNAVGIQVAGTADNYQFTDLDPGTYYVAVQYDASSCLSPFLREVIVPDYTPEMTLSLKEQEIFIECTGADEGKLRVEVQNAVGGFTFNWYEGSDTSGPLVPGAINVGRSSTIENLTNNEYTVEVIDQSGQACIITETFTVALKQIIPVLSASKLSDQTVCNADGSIRVNGIQINGTTADTTQYELTWYKGSVDAAGATLFANGGYYSNPTIANQYDSLDAGVYFIQAEAEFANGCSTNIEQVTISNQSTVLQVTGEIFNNFILACDPSQFAEGEIEIEVLNAINFTTAWYQGENIDEAQRITGLANDAVNVQGLAPATYTVKVTDTDTGCEAIRSIHDTGHPRTTRCLSFGTTAD